jgi:hypothetical protein
MVKAGIHELKDIVLSSHYKDKVFFSFVITLVFGISCKGGSAVD